MDPIITRRVWGDCINPVKSTDQADFCKQPVNPLQRTSLVGIVTRLRVGMMRFPAGTRDFLFFKTPTPALGPTHSGYWDSSPALKLPGRERHLVPRLRICGGIPPMPYTPS